jgi:hypothetical protein
MPSPLAPSFPAFPSAPTFSTFFLALLSTLCIVRLEASRRHFTAAHSVHPFHTFVAASLLAAILACGIACGGASGTSTPQRQTDPAHHAKRHRHSVPATSWRHLLHRLSHRHYNRRHFRPVHPLHHRRLHAHRQLPGLFRPLHRGYLRHHHPSHRHRPKLFRQCHRHCQL